MDAVLAPFIADALHARARIDCGRALRQELSNQAAALSAARARADGEASMMKPESVPRLRAALHSPK
jgi:hypothetical protein